MTQDLQKEVERLRTENAKLKHLIEEAQKMGCVYKANMTGCPGCYLGIEMGYIETPPTPAKESCRHEWVWERNDPSLCGKCGAKWQRPNPPESERG